MSRHARSSRLGALVALAGLSVGCQTYGAFSSPKLVKESEIRLGATASYHHFAVTDERLRVMDGQFAAQIGATERTEVDVLVDMVGVEGRVKEALLQDRHGLILRRRGRVSRADLHADRHLRLRGHSDRSRHSCSGQARSENPCILLHIGDLL